MKSIMSKIAIALCLMSAITGVVPGLLAGAYAQSTKARTFHFRIRTKDGGIVNTSVWADDVFQAQFKLRQRYPDCQILSGD